MSYKIQTYAHIAPKSSTSIPYSIIGKGLELRVKLPPSSDEPCAQEGFEFSITVWPFCFKVLSSMSVPFPHGFHAFVSRLPGSQAKPSWIPFA